MSHPSFCACLSKPLTPTLDPDATVLLEGPPKHPSHQGFAVIKGSGETYAATCGIK